MKVLFFCSDRYGAIRALEILIRKGVDVVGCVAECSAEGRLNAFCRDAKIPLVSYDELCRRIHEKIPVPFDYGISYLFGKRITKLVIDYANGKIINFHPAPVNKHKGLGACVYCLLKGFRSWATTAHFIEEAFDSGDVIKMSFYNVPAGITAIELERLEQENSLRLFEEVVDLLISGAVLPHCSQEKGVGEYYSRKDLEADKLISLEMSASEIDRRIMSFWYPPYQGAHIIIDGKKYSLVNEEILEKLAELYK